MKTFKMLIMAALAILSFSSFAQISAKEIMKMEVMKISAFPGQVGNAQSTNMIPCKLSQNTPAYSLKEKMKINIYSIPTRSNICPICGMNMKDMAYDCCTGTEKLNNKLDGTSISRPGSNLSNKEKMKMNVIKI
jgi:hypothetical protein